MHLSLSQEDEILGESLRKFALENLTLPLDACADPVSTLGALRRELADFGLWSLHVPEEHGGAGLTLVTAIIAIEEIARRDPGLASLLAIHLGLFCPAALHLGLTDSDDFTGFLDGSLHLGILSADGCIEADQALSLSAGAQGLAPLDGMDRFFLLSSGPTPRIGYYRADALRLSATPLLGLTGLSRIALSEDTALASGTDHCLQDPHLHRRLLDSLSLTLAAVALGIGTRALQEARSYAAERQQFGQTLDRFQAIQFKLADIATSLETSRWLLLRAAAEPCPDLSSAALTASLEASFLAADEALQIHGGYGYTREYPVEFLYRHAVELRQVATSLCPKTRR